MDCSFAPDLSWFVFTDTGQTVRTGFREKRNAWAWIQEHLNPTNRRGLEMAKKPSKPAASKPMSYGKPKGKGGKGRGC